MACNQRGCLCRCKDCGKGNHKHSTDGTGCHVNCTGTRFQGGSKPGSAGRNPGETRPKGAGSRPKPRSPWGVLPPDPRPADADKPKPPPPITCSVCGKKAPCGTRH